MRYGLPVSASLHVIVLTAALVALPGGEPLVVQEDALPVDLMTPQEFAKIAKGDKAAERQDNPKAQADKQEPPKPTPDNPSQRVAKHDAADPRPPTPEPQTRPPEIDRAAREAKAAEAKAQAAKEEAQRQALDRQAAEAAQQKAALDKALEQAAKEQAAKDAARKLEDMARQAAAEEARQKAAAEKAARDKAIAEKAAAQKIAQQQKPLDLANIEDLLNKDKPARTARSGEEVSPTASLGKPDANAPKLSISERQAIQGAIIDHVTPCWNKPAYAADPKALAVLINVDFNKDGTLAVDPQITRYPASAGGAAAASAAMRALKRCITAENPVKLPPHLFSGWGHVEVNFNPGG